MRGATYPTYLSKLKSLQNRAIIITNYCWSSFSRFSKLILLRIAYCELMTCSNLKSPNLFTVPDTTKLQIHFANISVKLMTAQVEPQSSRVIVTI